ncbi:YnfC family lipoprotein [Entomohabitans teleogrylli]|uniref:YnfC family lipoprotein n=1 Tax=Entomohabitans teleogrylli TaxID=1384589 RepID=UPI0020114A4B|nr:YnfC family lipoprotein [Entomohabitans teleogrylli]
MKSLLPLCLLSALLAGCDKPAKPEALTPEMASFSNIFNFDPLRGPVKAFTQRMINQENEVEHQIGGVLSAEGCFERLAVDDRQENTGVALVLNANYYLDEATGEKRIRLRGKCQLAEIVADATQFDTDERDFVVASRNGEVARSWRYDTEGYTVGEKMRADGYTLLTVIVPNKDPRQKLNYTATSRLDNNPIGQTTQQCEYDRYYNPVSCVLTVTDSSQTPTQQQRYQIKNTIEYY